MADRRVPRYEIGLDEEDGSILVLDYWRHEIILRGGLMAKDKIEEMVAAANKGLERVTTPTPIRRQIVAFRGSSPASPQRRSR